MKKFHVSVTLKNAALKNIRMKISVLQHFAKQGVPYITSESGDPIFDEKTGNLELDFYPRNFSQFSKWTTDPHKNRRYQNCVWVKEQIGNFTTHSPDTLDKYPSLKAQAFSILKAVKKKAREQNVRNQDGDKIKLLASEIDHWRAMAEAAGSKFLEYQDRLMVSEKKVKELERALLNAQEGVKMIEESKDSIIAELKRQLFEVRRFKKVLNREEKHE